jgi:putative nucleotidyltransferase with HDIG domain
MPQDLKKLVYALKHQGQRKDKHPEGNVLKHTIIVTRRALKTGDIDLALAAIFHDIGKSSTAGVHPKKGHITHFGHEKVSSEMVKKYSKWIKSMGGSPEDVYYIVTNHMRMKVLDDMRPKKQEKYRSHRLHGKLKQFATKIDRGGRKVESLDQRYNRFLFESKLEQSLPKNVRKAITSGGGKIYQVGGAVRDELLGKVSKDLDLLVTGMELSVLERILKPYGKVNLVGKSFGIIKFKPSEGTDNDEDIDISVPRIDSKSTGKGHKDFKVQLGKGITLKQDQLRRDFWMNALSKDIETGEIHDVDGKGQLSIANKEVEMISPRAFQEDPLRMLRAIQFAARFDFTIEKKTFKEIQKNARSIKTIAAERIQEELKKMFEKSTDVSIGIDYLFSTGIMKHLFPQAATKRNKLDTRTINKLNKKAFPAFLALMLSSADADADAVSSAAVAKLKITKNDARAMAAVIRYRAKGFNMNDIDFVQMIRQDARNIHTLNNLNALALASSGVGKSLIPSYRLAAMKKKKIPYSLSQLKVSGQDLTSLGLKGRAVGDALRHLLHFAIRTGKTDKDSLMKEIKRKYSIK